MIDALLLFGAIAAVLLFDVWLVARYAQRAGGLASESGPPAAGAGAAAGDSGEAACAHTARPGAPGSPLPGDAPASPHPIEGERLESVHFSIGDFLGPDGMCAWCFQPHSVCRHKPREYFFST